MEVFKRMRVDKTETCSKQTENLRLFTDANSFLSIVKFFETEIDLEQESVIA